MIRNTVMNIQTITKLNNSADYPINAQYKTSRIRGKLRGTEWKPRETTVSGKILFFSCRSTVPSTGWEEKPFRRRRWEKIWYSLFRLKHRPPAARKLNGLQGGIKKAFKKVEIMIPCSQRCGGQWPPRKRCERPRGWGRHPSSPPPPSSPRWCCPNRLPSSAVRFLNILPLFGI